MGEVHFAADMTEKRAASTLKVCQAFPLAEVLGILHRGKFITLALGVPNLQAAANFQRQPGNKLHSPKRKTVTAPPLN